jgi:hypothetical protein
VTPLVTLLALVVLAPTLARPTPAAPTEPTRVQPAPARGRLVLIAVDSLRRRAVDAHMPALRAWAARERALDLDVRTCAANATLPCMQVLLEGRPRALAEGLHNFSGKPGAADGLPAALEAAGHRVAMFSDLTLGALYGDRVTLSVDVDRWGATFLERDLRMIREATDAMRARTHDALVLHVVGTDKVAHRKNPGHPDYAAHFAAVDAELGRLLDTLDPRDHVVVTGDHGHDAHGHHTRDSLAFVRSPLLSAPLRARLGDPTLAQHELTYLAWWATGLPVHPDYAGRLFAMGEADAARFEARRRARAASPWADLARHAPMIVVYLWWVLWAARRGAARPAWTLLLGACALEAALLVLAAWAPPWAMGALAAALAAAMARGVWRAHATRRIRTWMLALIALAFAAAALEPWWGGHGAAATLAGALAVGALGSRWLSGRWDTLLPEATGAVCLVALPSGMLAHQFGQNVILGFVVGGVALLGAALARAARRGALRDWAKTWGRQETLAAALIGAGALTTLGQDVQGSHWTSWLTRALEQAGPGASALLYVATAALASRLLPARPGARTAFALLTALPVAYSVVFARLPWPALAAGALPFAWALAMGHVRPLGRAPEDEALRDARAGWWMLGLALFGFWVVMSGFVIEHIDYRFTYPFLAHLNTDAEVATWSTPPTALKYLLPAWLWFFASYWARDDDASWSRQVHWFWVFVHLKCAALLLQIFARQTTRGPFVDVAAPTELVFVMGAGVFAACATACVAAARARRGHAP